MHTEALVSGWREAMSSSTRITTIPGQNHAQDVDSRKCRKAGLKVKVVKLPDEAKDIAEYLDSVQRGKPDQAVPGI